MKQKILPIICIVTIIGLFILCNSPLMFLATPDQIIVYNHGKSTTLEKNQQDYTYIWDETRLVLWKNAFNIFGHTKSAQDKNGPETVGVELIYSPSKLLQGTGAFISFSGNQAEMFVSGNGSDEYLGGRRLDSSSNLIRYISKN